VGGAARPLHDPGNHRPMARGSHHLAARRGRLILPASPAGERDTIAAPTPPPGTRSIPEFEAAIIMVRAISKFFTVYKTESPAMKSFVRWTFEQGHLPMPSSLDDISDAPSHSLPFAGGESLEL
jgi:hypothetical protein